MILNGQMVVDASQALAWLAASHLGCLPNGSPGKMILPDESKSTLNMKHSTYRKSQAV